MAVPVPMSVVAAAPAQQTMNDGPLCKIPSIFCTQKVDDLEVFTNGMFERKNRYKIYAEGYGKIFKAKEESGTCERLCCAPNHSLKMQIKEDEAGFESYVMEKPFALAGCFACFNFCKPEAKVYKKSGELVGRAQRPTCGGILNPVVEIFDDKDTLTGTLTGPTGCIGAFCNSDFHYANAAGEVTGGISNKKGEKGCCASLCSDADDFELKFDPAMNENQRATMIGTMLMLDFMHFEDDGAFKCDGKSCSVKCCDLYCCGCRVPLKIGCCYGDDRSDD